MKQHEDLIYILDHKVQDLRAKHENRGFPVLIYLGQQEFNYFKYYYRYDKSFSDNTFQGYPVFQVMVESHLAVYSDKKN